MEYFRCMQVWTLEIAELWNAFPMWLWFFCQRRFLRWAVSPFSIFTGVLIKKVQIQNAFGMNVKELASGGYGSLAHYVEATAALTLVTVWVVLAFQNSFTVRGGGSTWAKLLWPVLIFRPLFYSRKKDGGILPSWPHGSIIARGGRVTWEGGSLDMGTMSFHENGIQ